MNTALALLAALPLPDAQPDLTQTLEPTLVEVVERFRLPGLAIGVVKDGEVIYARAFGEASRGGGQPLTTASIFHMASVSKPFVATAVMQLVEVGKMDLDAPLTEYLPYFELGDERYTDITVRQVLTHTSGMPDVQDYEWDNPQTDEGAAERFVRSLTGERMLFDPGEQLRYSNMAFDIMGDVIAKVSGMPFEDYVRTSILEPIGMTHSSFIRDEIQRRYRTQGHSLAHSRRIDLAPCPVYPYNHRHAPSSTLNSSVDDMCRWALANLARGELDGQRILAQESYDVMWARDDETPSIGLSWFLDDVMGHAAVSHSGGDTGFNSFIKLLPGEGLGVVVMVNSDMSPASAIGTAALLAALGEGFTLPKPRISLEIGYLIENEGMDAAIERFLELEETEPDLWTFGFSELDRVREGLTLYERYDEAVEIAALGADVYSDVAAAHTRLGQAMMATGNTEGARQSFEYALRLAPSDSIAKAGLEGLDQE